MTGLQTFSTDLFIPEYRPLASGEWELRVSGPVVSQGYWSPATLSVGLPSLARRGEVWMSLTPMEIESAQIGIGLSKGHVLIMGLGMGWAAAATAMREEVSTVTVVEHDPDVLALHRELDLFSQLPEAARTKIRPIEGDAFTYAPDAPVDLLMPDIWLPLINDRRIDEVREMQVNVGAASVYFWGQELEIARRARAAGRAIDAEGIAATITGFGLPLIGPEWPDYPALVEAAAARWMRGKWLGP
ncbi:hypothetical protein OF829_13345 [Sphingomonas sp. LB-2]|uniref:hypothetical protein n=1 Tax=Sphingomonas caeni TaxID=2984949 RepID=UPI0022323BC6|nr:hypothetical protein [Sphingomonas caeni]MCW3848225.1 hypothetical protein [Sphingomonas caeni]